MTTTTRDCRQATPAELANARRPIDAAHADKPSAETAVANAVAARRVTALVAAANCQ